MRPGPRRAAHGEVSRSRRAGGGRESIGFKLGGDSDSESLTRAAAPPGAAD